ISEVIDEEEGATDQQNLIPDQQSFGSVSTLALPSPALSSIGAASEKMREKKGSWVWRWAEKRTDVAGNIRVYCLVPGCLQKKGWVWIGSSTSNIRNHLIGDHHLNGFVQKDGVYTGQTGSIESVLANKGKRSSAHFSTDVLERHICKILVRHKLPYTFVQSPLLKELLDLAHAAPSTDALKLPSDDTISKRMSKQHEEYEELLRGKLAT
ncbi:hypothetical protein BGZ50_001391, partial [Haplosporangium sp. Z 11]